MLKTCPDPVDVQDIQFKLHCSLKIFDNNELETFTNNHSLVSAASRYGLLFVGSNSNLLRVIQLKTVENYNPKEKEISNFPRRNIPLPSVPKHVCVNCDSTLLAIVLEKDNCPTVIFYDVLSFYKQNINVIKEVRLSASPGVYATEVNWNPALSNIFTACKSDRSLGIYEIKGNSVDINELPQAAESTSFCWSPKGKQIAVGSKNGNITQYKPDLKAVKVINGPTFETPHSLISLCWVSNYQFIGIYQAAEDGRAKLVVVDAPKTGETSYTNYDDVCYSGASRTPQFYLILLQHWNMLMIASSNSMELGLLGGTSEIWTQWNVPDFARAELPLSDDKQDTLPVGMALDTSSTKPLPWGEGTISPCPYLLLLSHQGVLYFFNIVNLKEGIPFICCPPDSVNDMSGIGQFIVEVKEAVAKSTPQQQPQSTFSFGAPQPPQVPIQPTLIQQTPQPTQPFQTTPSAFSFAKPVPPTQQPLPSFGVAPSSAPPTTSLFGKPIDSKPLFGPQVTVTPIVKPQPQTQTEIPSSASVFANPSLNLTPFSKPTSTSTDTGSSGEKYSSIFAALKAPSALPASTSDMKPIVISGQSAKPEIHFNRPTAETVAIPETPKSAISETPRINVDAKAAVEEKVKVETDALLAKMVRDECLALESELKALLHQGRRVNVNIGSEEEKIKMVKDLHNLRDFIKEIVDVSLGESAEIHSLKQNLILSWAWFEEAMSRYITSKDETMTMLLKSQPLDSAAEKRQTDIRKSIYYLESQLYQASKALDEQWDNFQDYAKKTYKVQMPTMEAIFQSMVLENALLNKQSYIIDYLGSRLKQNKTASTTPSLFLSLNNSDKLEESLSRLRLDPDDGHRIFYEQALERSKTLSFSKRNKLRNLLKSHEVTHVTAAKPQLNSSLSLIRSPIAKNKHIISILGAQMSPVLKPSFAKHLDFSESTPVKFVQDFKPTTVPPNTPAQPDPSRTFTFKGIEKSNIVASPITIPIPKNAALLSQNQSSNSSAFVPTTPTSKTFLVPQPPSSSTTLPFNFSSKQESATITNASQLNFGSAISITPIAKRPDTTPAASSAKSSFNFVPSANLTTKTDAGTTAPAIVAPVASKPIFAGGSLTPFGGEDAAQSLFSFGKTPSVSSTVKSTPSSQSSFSFGKTAPSTISPADSTVNVSSAKTASITPISTKPVSFVTPTFSEASTTLPKIATPATTSRPISFGSTATSTTATTTKSLDIASTASTAVKVTSPVSTNSFSFSFGAGSTTTNSLFSGATTTTTTSLFGSIATPSVVSSIFGAKPITSVDTTTPFSLDNTTKSISSSAAVTSTIKSTTPTSLPTTKPIFTTVVTSSSPLVSFDTSSTPAASSPVVISSGASPVSASSISNTPSIFASGTAPISSTVSIFASSTPPVSSTPSVFGSSPPVSSTKPFFATSLPSTTSSIFSSAAATVTTSNTASIFGATTATTPSVFSSASKTSSDSIFAAATVAPNSPGSIFGGTSTVNATTTSPVSSNTNEDNKSSIFSQPAFGSDPTSTSSIFASSTTTTQPALFSSPATTTQTSIFSNPVATTQSSIFGTPTTSDQSAFGSNATSAPASVFGTPAATAQASIFGSSIAGAPVFGGTTTVTEAPIFGTNTTSTAPVFGGTTTTQSSIFGAPSSSAASIFGSTPTTQTSIFGAASPTTTQGSIFGSPPSLTSSNSVFGGANTTSAFGTGFGQTGSIFGAKTTTSTFGGPSSFGTPQTTAFSQSAPFGTNTGSIFGTPTTTSSVFGASGGTFGAVSSSGNVFGTGASSSFSFASAANPAGSLGFGELNVGGSSPVSGGSIFGGSPTFGQTPPNPFARAADQKPAFGDGSNAFGTPTTGSVFGSSTGNSGSIFGGNTQNAFGSTSFGSPAGFGQQPAPFGQSGGFGGNTPFGGTQPGPFSGGGVGVGQTGFGSPGNFQKQSGGFGAAPVFGGSPQPAFGTSPSFGATPAFGGAAAFGSPSKVFGGSPPASSFGQSTGSASPGFGNLATQNTVGFGSLAQQAATPTSQFSGGSSFSSWR